MPERAPKSSQPAFLNSCEDTLGLQDPHPKATYRSSKEIINDNTNAPMSFVGAAPRARPRAPGQAGRIRSPGMFRQPRGVSSEPASAPIHRDGLAAPQVLLGALHQHGQPAARHAALLDGTHQLGTRGTRGTASLAGPALPALAAWAQSHANEPTDLPSPGQTQTAASEPHSRPTGTPQE